jgi:hypothetical protein
MPLQNLRFAFATLGLVAQAISGNAVGGVAVGAGESGCGHI